MGLAKLIIRKGALGAESKDEVELLMRRCYDNSFTEVGRSNIDGGYFYSSMDSVLFTPTTCSSST
jgi:hypothetical protein